MQWAAVMSAAPCPRCRFVPVDAERRDCCGLPLSSRPKVALALPDGALFARVPPRGALAGLVASWLVAFFGPWALLGGLLIARGPLADPAANDRWFALLGGSDLAWRLFLVQPHARAAALALVVALVALVAATAAWRAWRRRQPPVNAVAAGHGWEVRAPLVLTTLPTLAACSYAAVALRAGLPAGAPTGALPSGEVALSGTLLAGLLLLAAAPLLALVAALRWLRARHGWCEIGADQVLFAPPAVAPRRLVVAKRDLGARRVTPAGVRVEVPGAGALLIPTRSAEESDRVIARLDEVDLAAEDVVDGGSSAGGPWRARAAAALLVGAPTLWVTARLGVAWALPALVGVLALEAAALALLLRQASVDASAARLHFGRDGLLARRWVPYAGIQAIVPTPTGLALEEAGGRRHLLVLDAAGRAAARARLAARLGRAVPVVPRRWALPGPRRRALAGATALGVVLALVAAALPGSDLLPASHLVVRDELGNAATLIHRPGALDRLLLLGPPPRAITLSGTRRLELPDPDGELELDVPRSRVRAGDGPWVELPADARAAVVTRHGDRLEVEVAPPPALATWLQLHALAALPPLPATHGLPLVLARAGLPRAPVWDRYETGETSARIVRVVDRTREELVWLVDHGQVEYVIATPTLASARRVNGRLTPHLIGPWTGWTPDDPGRLLLEHGDFVLAFPGEPPALARLVALRAQVAAGSTVEDAARGWLPFHDLTPPEGFTRRKARAWALALCRGRELDRLRFMVGLPEPEGPAEVEFALQAMQELLRSPVARTREAAARGLTSSRWPLTREAGLDLVRPLVCQMLPDLLRDPEPSVRLAAAEAMVSYYHLDLLEAVAPLLRADPSDEVRVGILDSMIECFQLEVDPAAALRLLRPLLGDPHPEVRRLSQRHLEFVLGSSWEGARPALVAELGPLLEDRDAPWPLRRRALEAVLRGDREVMRPLAPALRRLLGRPGPARELAARAAHRLEDGCACGEAPSALCWLATRQEEDGRWASPRGDHDLGVTALAALAFTAQGHTHRFGLRKASVRAGLTWLRARQGPDGGFEGPPLDQALATQALCEAFAVSCDAALRAPAQAAVGALTRAQAADGGWGSTLLTAHAVLALKSARTGGIDVPDEALARACARLKEPDRGDEAGVPVSRAAALLGRLRFSGERAVRAEILGSDLTWPAADQAAPVYWHFATHVMFAGGRPDFARWGPALDDMLTELQAPPGDPEQGSWAPAGCVGAWGGRAATTALNALTLEIHRRYLRALAD